MTAPAPVAGAHRHWHRRFHWRHLLLAPHRLSFFLAMVVLVLCALWWVAEQLSRSGWVKPWSYAVPSALLHAAIMSLGFMPLFFAGFVFTAGPKWLHVQGPSARALAPPLLAQAAGWLLWLAGGHLHAGTAALGLLLSAAGLMILATRLWRMVIASRLPDRLHPKAIAVAFTVGCISLAGVAASVLADEPTWAFMFVHSGLWGFVVAVFVTVAHRMIPFFSSDALALTAAWRPGWMLGLMLAMAAAQALAPWVDAALGPARPWQIGRALAELALGGLLIALALAWGLVKSLRVRLLSMLHVGFLWLGLALALGAASRLLSIGSDVPALPLAWLHALAMGCLGSLMLAMVTRVTCGHSGRSQVTDNLLWCLFWLLQLATLLRIAAAVPTWPAQWLLTAAALLWGGLMLTWGIRYGSWYGRTRPDGRPG